MDTSDGGMVSTELQAASDRLDAARAVVAALKQALEAANTVERDLTFEFNRALRSAREAGTEPAPEPPSLLDQAMGRAFLPELEALVGRHKSRFEK